MNTLLKKSSIFANLLMEKPDNSFAIVKMKKKNTCRKNILRKGYSSLLKNSVWDSFQSLIVQINLLVSPTEEHRLQTSYSKQLVG